MNQKVFQEETEEAEIKLFNEVPVYNNVRAALIYKLIKGDDIHSVLDIGCGTGKVANYLSKKGLNVIGIDISEKLISIANTFVNKNLSFVCSSIDDFKPKERFDCILLAGVLEHIEDDVFLKKCMRFLKDGGKIVITDLPTIQFLNSPRDVRLGHYRRYTRKGLINLLNDCDCDIIKIRYWNFLMLIESIILRITGKDEYPYHTLGNFKRWFIGFWYTNIENRFLIPLGDRFVLAGKKRK